MLPQVYYWIWIVSLTCICLCVCVCEHVAIYICMHALLCILLLCLFCVSGQLGLVTQMKRNTSNTYTSQWKIIHKNNKSEWIIRYPSLHNILSHGQYPVLLLMGDHDDQLVSLHSMVTMQEQLGKHTSSPLMIKLDVKSSRHGAGNLTHKWVNLMQ